MERVDFVIPILEYVLSFDKRSCCVSVIYDDKLKFVIDKF